MFKFRNKLHGNIIIHIKYYKDYEILTKQYPKSNDYHTKHQT